MELAIKIDEEIYKDIKDGFYHDNARKMAIAIGNGKPLEKVLEDIKTEIKQNILDKPAKNGTNGEMACYNSGLLTTFEIIEKYISKKE